MVLAWIVNGYKLVWSLKAPERRVMDNAPSARDHNEFVSSAVAEMMAEGTVTRLPPGEKPSVVSLLGVVPKLRTDKSTLTVNMRYVNGHLGKKAFKFEGLKNLADLAERGDHAVFYDLISGYYHVGLHRLSRTYVGFKCEELYYVYNCLPFGLSTTPWVFSKVYEGVGNALEEERHQGAVVLGRLHVHEVQVLAMHTGGAAGGGELHQGRALNQCA